MRLRRKKHLEDRVSASSAFLINRKTNGVCVRNGSLSDDFDPAFLDKDGFLDFHAIFGNDNPVFLEIGCGKGAFSLAYAEKYPKRNLLAVEKITNVLVAALENAEKKRAQGIALHNLRPYDGGAEFLAQKIKKGIIG